jgi:RimJ/RimL family protein N-acetyltransferase
MPSMRFWPLSGRGRSTPASDNVASRRVLEKCGFGVIATERNVAEARSSEIEELVLRLDELTSTE